MDTHTVLWPVRRDLHLHNAWLTGAGPLLLWVTVGAVKKCSTLFSECILSETDRRGVLTITTTHRQTHMHTHILVPLYLWGPIMDIMHSLTPTLTLTITSERLTLTLSLTLT